MKLIVRFIRFWRAPVPMPRWWVYAATFVMVINTLTWMREEGWIL